MKRVVWLVAVASLWVFGCAHAPTQPGERADLVRNAEQTLARMEARDPTLRPLIDRSVGYVVFPAVGQGGFLVGGGAGSGVLFENGQPVHFATVSNMAVGAIAGGQRFAQVVVLRDPAALVQLKSGRFAFGAQASAVMLRSGAAAGATFDKGTAVFVEPVHGAILNASIGGQRIRLTL